MNENIVEKMLLIIGDLEVERRSLIVELQAVKKELEEFKIVVDKSTQPML